MCIRDRGVRDVSVARAKPDRGAMRLVVVPQGVRRVLPALVNQFISLIKDSSLVSAIGLAELAYAARTVAGVYSRYWEPYLTISFIYLALTMLMAWGISRLEKKLHIGTR